MAVPPSLQCLRVLLLLVFIAQLGSAADVSSSESRIGILRGSEGTVDLSKVIPLSTTPKVFLYQNLLSDFECDYLIRSAKGKLDPPNGLPLGSATFLQKYQDGLVRKVEDRITEWIFPTRNAPEALKELRYNKGQSYDVHYEFYSNPSDDKRKGHRAATIILFLSDVESGGEIVFPDADMDNATAAAQRQRSAANACTAKGLVVKPQKGAALFFLNLHPDGQFDPTSNFMECPVTSGEKWMAAKWVAVQKYSTRRDPNECIDEHEQCAQWARAGECEKNPTFMVGKAGSIGSCRKACKVCTPKA